MNRIVVQSRVDADGVVRIAIPVGEAEADRPVQVTVESAPARPAAADTPRDRFDPNAARIEDELAEIFAEVPASEWSDLPPDLSSHLDHYIYGTPK
jgi:hypothetical protein